MVNANALTPFAVTFKSSPRARQTQTWHRYMPSLDAARADALRVVTDAYARGVVLSVEPLPADEAAALEAAGTYRG
jgi:hypothetical protein